jgi:Predicted glycosyltransferases
MAINTAAKNAGDWDLAIVADADSFIEPHQLYAAVEIAKAERRLVIPHSRWVNVAVEETRDFLLTGKLLYDNKRNIYGTTVSSILVIPREVWDTVNGFDERFVGWGWEDVAFMEAVEVLAGGPIRMEGSVYHLAHDRPVADTNRQLDPGYIRNRMHNREYKLAKTPGELRRIVARNRVTL